MVSEKSEIHLLIRTETLKRLEDDYKRYKNGGKGIKSFSRYIENALIFYLTEKGALIQ